MTTNNKKSTQAIGTDADLVSAAIRTRIAAARRDRGMTFDQLASLSDVSKGMLVQIEQGKANPSIATLCKVASALRVSVAELVEMPEKSRSPVKVNPARKPPRLWTGSRGGSAVLLVGAEGPDMLELWQWELFPGERFDAQPHSKGTRELIHVTEGELALEVDRTVYAVKNGGSAVAHTDRPHAYACTGDMKVRFTMVVFEPER